MNCLIFGHAPTSDYLYFRRPLSSTTQGPKP